MAALSPHPEPNPRQAGPTLFFVVLGVILALLAAFLVLRPHPAGAPKKESLTKQH